MVLKHYMCSKNIFYASDIYVIFIGHGDLSYTLAHKIKS